MPTVFRVAILAFLFLATVMPTNAQALSQSSPAGVQALACEYPDQKPDCEMYFAAFTDTVNMVIVEGAADQATNMLCGNLDAPDLVAEFEQEARKTPEADTNTVLFRLLTTNHLCRKKAAQVYSPKSAGELIDLCHTGDIGFNLCSEYQKGFLYSLFFLTQRMKTPVVCGDMRMLGSAIVMLNGELEADHRLRPKPAVSLMLGALMKHMPCPKPETEAR